CTPIDIGMPDSVMKNRKPAMPVAKATGMPIAMRTTKTIPTSSISELQHFGIFLLCGRSGVDEELVALTAPGLGHVVGNRSGKQRAADRHGRGHPGIGEGRVPEDALAVD